MLPSCCGHAAGAPAGAARGGVRFSRSRRRGCRPVRVCIPGCSGWALLRRRGAGRRGPRQPERPPGAGAAPTCCSTATTSGVIGSTHCKRSLLSCGALWDALIARAVEHSSLAVPSGRPRGQHARKSWTKLQGLSWLLKHVSCWGVKQALAGAAWPRRRRPGRPRTAARADRLVPIVPSSAARTCAQVAPREVLFARNRLTGPTARCLASPPIPLLLSPVEPGAEFPDAQDMGAFQEGAQARPPALAAGLAQVAACQVGQLAAARAWTHTCGYIAMPRRAPQCMPSKRVHFGMHTG